QLLLLLGTGRCAARVPDPGRVPAGTTPADRGQVHARRYGHEPAQRRERRVQPAGLRLPRPPALVAGVLARTTRLPIASSVSTLFQMRHAAGTPLRRRRAS